MPEIKTYRADTMQEALGLVRRELGPDALILHTRQVERKSYLPWQPAKVETEITAARDESPSQPTSLRREIKPSITRHASPSTAGHSTASGVTPRADSLAGNHATQMLARETQSQPKPQFVPSPSRWTELPEYQPKSQQEFPNRVDESTAATESAAERPTRSPQPVSNTHSPHTNGPDLAELTESARLEAFINERLASLQNMVEQLTLQLQTATGPNIPAQLRSWHERLIDADVEPQIALELIGRLHQQCRVDELDQPERLQQKLLGLLETSIACTGPIRVRAGRQKIVALVGPTGVGKTTTIAKLAANFRLRDNIKMGLITVDTYRIAAVEQLRTYADIIDLPMKVVTSPEQMQQAVEELGQMDLILIDTAGRSPQDELQINELKQFLEQIVVDETHLVLNATMGLRHLRKTVEKFAPIRPTSAIFTKLDEAPGAGATTTIAGSLGLPLSYLTTGQNVPKDIEPADASRIARMILPDTTT